MSFAPVLPLGGVAGWALIKRVEAGQREAFARRPDVARETAYFVANVAGAATPAELVGDRRLLGVALGAFGLGDEIDKRALLRKVLESDPLDPKSFANRLVDPRYRDLAAAFGYASIGGARVARADFAMQIAGAYRERTYEVAVGESDNALRIALNARRELAAYAASPSSDGATWFRVLGDLPVREVFEGAFGLPSAFGQLDVDRQRDELKSRTRGLFGDDSMKVFADPEAVDQLIRRYLARAEAAQGPTGLTRGATALTLLGGGLGAAGAQNLLLSQVG